MDSISHNFILSQHAWKRASEKHLEKGDRLVSTAIQELYAALGTLDAEDSTTLLEANDSLIDLRRELTELLDTPEASLAGSDVLAKAKKYKEKAKALKRSVRMAISYALNGQGHSSTDDTDASPGDHLRQSRLASRRSSGDAAFNASPITPQSRYSPSSSNRVTPIAPDFQGGGQLLDDIEELELNILGLQNLNLRAPSALVIPWSPQTGNQQQFIIDVSPLSSANLQAHDNQFDEEYQGAAVASATSSYSIGSPPLLPRTTFATLPAESEPPQHASEVSSESVVNDPYDTSIRLQLVLQSLNSSLTGDQIRERFLTYQLYPGPQAVTTIINLLQYNDTLPQNDVLRNFIREHVVYVQSPTHGLGDLPDLEDHVSEVEVPDMETASETRSNVEPDYEPLSSGRRRNDSHVTPRSPFRLKFSGAQADGQDTILLSTQILNLLDAMCPPDRHFGVFHTRRAGVPRRESAAVEDDSVEVESVIAEPYGPSRSATMDIDV